MGLTRLITLNLSDNPLSAAMEWEYRLPSLQTGGTKIIGLPRQPAMAGGAASSAAREALSAGDSTPNPA